MRKRLNKGVVFQPEVGRALSRGAATLIAAVRPTLGPLPRYTLVQKATLGGPEILDQAGVIARRVIALPNRNEDVGAMLARHLMWRMTDRVGDGAATAAVLFQAIYEQGRTYVTAGGNAMALRHHLQKAAGLALTELDTMVRPVEGREQLTRLAQAVCFDPPLAKVMGEIFDIIGEFGGLDIRSGRGRDLEREYVEGMYWDGGLLSRELATDIPGLRGELEDARVLVSNFEITDAEALIDLLDHCLEAGVTSLFIVARRIAPEAMSVLTLNKRAGKLQVVAARPPSAAAQARDDLEDLAVLTGARAFLTETGASIRGVRVEELGKARRAWADKDYFGVSGGSGDPRAIRRHLGELKAAYANLEAGADNEARQNLRRRIGKLLGGSATLWIGAATESEMETRKALAQRTAESLRAALLGGALPGGGIAFLTCRTTLTAAAASTQQPDERAAYRILARALEAPMRTIIHNAGAEPAAIMSALDCAPRGYGYDVERGQVVDMGEAGILDVAAVARLALSTAVSAAAMALTTDVLVHTDFDIQAAANITP